MKKIKTIIINGGMTPFVDLDEYKPKAGMLIEFEDESTRFIEVFAPKINHHVVASEINDVVPQNTGNEFVLSLDIIHRYALEYYWNGKIKSKFMIIPNKSDIISMRKIVNWTFTEDCRVFAKNVILGVVNIEELYNLHPTFIRYWKEKTDKSDPYEWTRYTSIDIILEKR